MKFPRILSAAVITTCLTATAAFAAPDVSSPSNVAVSQQKSDTVKKERKDFKGEGFKHKHDGIKQQDPIKALQRKKEKIQTLLKDGKITKEKADAIIARIDSKIKEIEEFNKLTPQQKKDKLISGFKASVGKRVEEGKLTQEKADELVKKFTEKVQKWDGNGYPQFHKKWFKPNKHRGNGNKE